MFYSKLSLFLYAGIGKAAAVYKAGKKTTDLTLEVLNLNRREVITIDLISNQDFTEVIHNQVKFFISFISNYLTHIGLSLSLDTSIIKIHYVASS